VLDLGAGKLALRLRVGTRHEAHRLHALVPRANVAALLEAPFAVEHRLGHIEDGAVGAVVRTERVLGAALRRAVEAFDVAAEIFGPRAPKAVDGLVVIGHAKEVASLLAQATDDVELNGIGVLKLVDEDRLGLHRDRGSDVGLVAKQVARLHEQVVKVERAPTCQHVVVDAQPFCERPRDGVDAQLDAADVRFDLAVAAEIVLFAPPLVLLIPPLPEGIGHRVVHHDEILREVCRVCVCSKDFVAEMVDGAGPHVLGVHPHEGGEAVGELAGGASREGDQDEMGRHDASLRNEVSGPADKNACLTGARPRHDELRLQRGRDGGLLGRVEAWPIRRVRGRHRELLKLEGTALRCGLV